MRARRATVQDAARGARVVLIGWWIRQPERSPRDREAGELELLRLAAWAG